MVSKLLIFLDQIKLFEITLEKAVIIITTIATPLLIRGKLYILPQEMIPHWIGTTHATDYFSFFRANLVLLMAVTLIVYKFSKLLFGSNNFNYNNSICCKENNQINTCNARDNFSFSSQIYTHSTIHNITIPSWVKIPIFVYFIFTVASIIFCDYPKLTIVGTPYRFEGSLIILSYLILLYTSVETSYFSNNKRFHKLIIYCIIFSAIIIGIIGVTQLIGKDIVRSKKFINFITNDRLIRDYTNKISFDVANGIVYGLLGNTNYTGSYASIIIPIAFCFYIFNIRWQKWFSLLFYILAFIVWIGCRSKAGWLGGVVAILYICIFYRKQIFNNFVQIVILFIVSLGLLFIIDYLSLIFKCDRLLFNFSLQKVTHEQFLKSDLVDIILASDSFELIHESSFIKCKYEPPETYRFYNKQGNEVQYKLVMQTVYFDTKDFWGSLVKIATESKVVQITRENIQYNFIHTNEGFRMLDALLRPFVPQKAHKIGFYQNERWGNGRGYIWSRSIPLLLDAWLVGFGADIFYIYFPQNDIISKIKAGYPVNWYVDKPHNLYLQIGISSGLPSLLAFVFLAFTYLYKSTLLLMSESIPIQQKQLLLLFTAPIIGYLVSGIFNDSVVGVAPLFWIILGTGIGYYLKILNK